MDGQYISFIHNNFIIFTFLNATVKADSFSLKIAICVQLIRKIYANYQRSQMTRTSCDYYEHYGHYDSCSIDMINCCCSCSYSYNATYPVCPIQTMICYLLFYSYCYHYYYYYQCYYYVIFISSTYYY